LADANLLLHVTDAADPQRDAQDAAVETLMESLGVASTPRLHVWNKVDLLEPGERRKLEAGPRNVRVSAQSGEGLDELRQQIDDALGADPVVEADFELAASDGKHLALLHRTGTVVSTEYEADRVRVRAKVRESVRARLQSPPQKALEER
jgi:GTP-binding protein HflX